MHQPFAMSLRELGGLTNQAAGFHTFDIHMTRINLYVRIYGAIMRVFAVIPPETQQARVRVTSGNLRGSRESLHVM